MSFYRLYDRYALRKFTNKIPFLIEYGYADSPKQISEEELNLLKKCDGITDIDINNLSKIEADILHQYIHNGVVNELSEPLPLKIHRAYKEYNHKRIAQATWALTLKCNLRCLHCLNLTEKYSNDEKEFSLENAKTIVDRLIEYGVEAIELFGGEPMIYPHFMEVVHMIYEAGMQINSIDSNGTLINEKILDEFKSIDAYPMYAISFDGLGTHDWMRNKKGCEEIVDRNIKLCLEKGFDVNVAININKKTLPVLDKTIDYFIKLGVKNFKLLRTSEAYRWQQTEKKYGEPLTLSYTDFSNIMLDTMRKFLPDIKSKNICFNLNHGISVDAFTSRNTLLPEIKAPAEKISGWCPVAENGIFIGYQGHVAPCPGSESLLKLHGLYTDEINILKHSLEDIVYSDFYRDHFRITRADIYNAEKECRECSRWKVCYGGICRMNVKMVSDIFGAVAPPDRSYFAQRDMIYCSLLKGDFIDKLADIFDCKAL